MYSLSDDWEAEASGVSARLPTMVMRATERGELVLKARAAPAEAATERRSRKEDMLEGECGCCMRG